MKNKFLQFFVTTACVVLLISSFYSCKKGSPNDPSPEDILQKKIGDVIPQQYLDTLKKLGFPVNEGTTPPNMEGAYFVNNFKLTKSNVPGDEIGYQFNNAKFKLFNQSTKDYGISLIGEHLLTLKDTSVTTAISGSGNNFTIYGKIKSVTKPYTAIFATIISGVKVGNNIKNLKVGLINVDDMNTPPGIFIPEGLGRVAYDADLTSEGIDYDTKSSAIVKENIFKSLINSGAVIK